MKTITSVFFSVIVLATLFGCSGIFPGPKFAVIAQPIANTAEGLVYVYRYADGRWVGRVNVSVDGKKIARIGDWEYSWCRVSPGNHTFRAEWGFMDKPMMEGGQFDAKTLNMKVEPNKTYYVCYAILENGQPTTLLESSGLLGKALSKSHVSSVTLLSEDEAHALPVLKGCEFSKSDMNK